MLLKWLESNKLWVDFFIAAADIWWQRRIIQHILESLTTQLGTVSSIVQDKRCITLRVSNPPPPPPPHTHTHMHTCLVSSIPAIIQIQHVPAGYFPEKATGDGNCFYNSVSLLLTRMKSWLFGCDLVVSNRHTHALAIDTDYIYTYIQCDYEPCMHRSVIIIT